MLTKKQILQFENIYIKNMDKYLYWEGQLTKQRSHDDWMKVIHKRSKVLRNIYLENKQQIDNLFNSLDTNLSEAIIDELYNMVSRIFYNTQYEDAIIMTRIVDTLYPYYEKKKDTLHILNLLNMKGFLQTEYFYRQSNQPEIYSYLSIHGKIHSYVSQYDQLSSEERRIIVSNFYNIICALPTILPHEVNQYLDIYDEFLVFKDNEAYHNLDQLEANICYRKNSICQEIWNIAEVIEHFDYVHLFHFYELIQNAYEKYQDNHQIIPDNLMAAYYYTCAYIHEQLDIQTGINWLSAYEHLIKKADELLVQLETLTISVLDENFFTKYYPYQQVANYAFRIYPHIKNRIDNNFIKQFIQRGTQLFNNFPKNKQSWIAYSFQSEWCENALRVLEDVDEQLALINDIVVKGQIQTYIHSQMVGLIANSIIKTMIRTNPKLLLSLPFFTSIDKVKEYEEVFLNYVQQAALLHDIGKNKIPLVINQQMRKLTDVEFDLIKQHPENPEKSVLKHTSNFENYYDIICGHHKSYDGKSGYPANFDNVNSPYRILIDVITISDSIDAATDLLGRNYAGGKDFQGVLQELINSKGTRYNPIIVDMIVHHQKLQEELEAIVTNGRDEIYFQTYKTYFE